MRFLKWLFPWRGDSAGMVVKKIIFIVFSIIFICLLAYLGSYFFQRVQSDVESQELSSMYDEQLPSEDRFKSLLELNSDVKGWISIEGTQVDYPVMQAQDNDYYLYKNIYGNYDISGTPFLGYRNELNEQSQSGNLVIYGHHMNFDGKFGVLLQYKNIDYYKQHPIINFDSIYKDMKWKVVAGFYASANPDQNPSSVFDYQNYLSFDTESRYNDFMNQAKSRSVVQTNVDTKWGDEFITISTCANEFKDGRFVVVARQLRDGESDSVDVSNAVYNSSTVYPDEWHP